MLDSKPIHNLLAAHFKLCNLFVQKTDEEKSKTQRVPYANVVGCLMYTIVLIKPNISLTVTVVNRYIAAPRKEHQRGVKWILRYLKGTMNLNFIYRRSSRIGKGLWGYVDSDYTRDLNIRRSLIGYMYMLNRCLINQQESLRHVVSLSTTKVEYTAATEVVKKAIWLNGLLIELGLIQEFIIVLCYS